MLQLPHGSPKGQLSWDPLPDAGLLPSLALCPWSPAPFQCFLLLFPSSGCLLRKRRPLRRTPRAVLGFAFLPRLCSCQGCSACCLPWEHWCSAWQVSGTGVGMVRMSPPRRRWPECHVHPDKAAFDLWFLVAVPTRCFSWFHCSPAAQGITLWVRWLLVRVGHPRSRGH